MYQTLLSKATVDSGYTFLSVCVFKTAKHEYIMHNYINMNIGILILIPIK